MVNDDLACETSSDGIVRECVLDGVLDSADRQSAAVVSSAVVSATVVVSAAVVAAVWLPEHPERIAMDTAAAVITA